MTVDLGRIKLVWQGVYSNSVTYVKDDLVFYSGSSWICTSQTTGNVPASASNFWSIFAQGITTFTTSLSVQSLTAGALVMPPVGNVIVVTDNGTGPNITITSVSNVVPGAEYRFLNSRSSGTANFTLSANGTNIYGNTTTINGTASPGIILAYGVSSTQLRVV